MKSKHIHQALNFLYDNRNNEQITEEVFKNAITDIHPVDFTELRVGLFLMGFIDKSSAYHEWKITGKGIEYLIKLSQEQKILFKVNLSLNWNYVNFVGILLSLVLSSIAIFQAVHDSAINDANYKNTILQQELHSRIQK